ncbi:hypothetical protein GW17_00037144 [Ensete ventricosum]|nr:hypothetical protein GW17_00037144 [Ensete ventricosum]
MHRNLPPQYRGSRSALPRGGRPCGRLYSRRWHLHGRRPSKGLAAGGRYPYWRQAVALTGCASARRRRPYGLLPLWAASYRSLASTAPCGRRWPPLRVGPSCSQPALASGQAVAGRPYRRLAVAATLVEGLTVAGHPLSMLPLLPKCSKNV